MLLHDQGGQARRPGGWLRCLSLGGMNFGAVTNAERPMDPKITNAGNAAPSALGSATSAATGSRLGLNPTRAMRRSTNIPADDATWRLRILKQQNHDPNNYATVQEPDSGPLPKVPRLLPQGEPASVCPLDRSPGPDPRRIEGAT